MISLRRARNNQSIPPDFSGARLIEKHEDLIQRFFAGQAAGQPIKFVSAKWKSAKKALEREAAQKCAYCEAPTSVVAHGDVEHFRPKSIYWWLAYGFDNYLFSCQICNQLYKGDKFPINGQNRLAAPQMPSQIPAAAQLRALAASLSRDATTLDESLLRVEWAHENADLIHPYLEDPEELFVYEADAINREVWVRAAAGARAQRALQASEQCLGINRETLRRQRFLDYETLETLFKVRAEPSLSQATKALIDQQLGTRKDRSSPFAGMSRFFLKRWGLP
jgi:hypothetical protein